MPKERSILTVPSNRGRVSPYPLRSSRSNKHESSIQTEGVGQWEDVRCVICMEPPHNALLLHCSSYSRGCRPYMCDTSARHSNCFKQFRRNNKNRLNSKILSCPLCRGEVYETMKVTSARRFMNAKPRSCSIDDCEFSGTYSQLQNHLKAEHPGLVQPKVDPWKQRMWEHTQREAEYVEMLSAAGIPPRHEVVHHHPVIHVSVDGIMRNIYGPSQVRSGFGAINYGAALMPRLEIRTVTMFHGWTP